MAPRDTVNNFLFTLFGFNRTKDPMHVLLIILVHCCGWCLLFLLPVLLYPVRIIDNRFISLELIDKSLLVILFYFHYYVLIPRLFEKKKYLQYTGWVLLCFVLYFVVHISIRYNYFSNGSRAVHTFQVSLPGTTGNREIRPLRIMGHSMQPGTVVYNSDSLSSSIVDFATEPGRISPPGPFFMRPTESVFGIPRGIIAMSLNNAISSFALLLIIGGFIRLAYSFVRNQNEKKALENATLNAEVNFLKSQINPHFLFNTLNGIYSQAHTRSEHTEHSILKLSDLLRYVLYDSGDEKVDLAKDIQYLDNYIDLQKLRISQKVTIQYEVEGDVNGKQIAPLLLITFVENAFKHGISYTRPSTIKIHISIFEKTLTLLVSNPVVESSTFTDGGLGLKNVSRRLDLLYPGKYLLDIIHNDHLHFVNLKINLNSD